jgi:hypothetical protein
MGDFTAHRNAGECTADETFRERPAVYGKTLYMSFLFFTPLEIMPHCSAAGLDFRIIPAGFNAPLEFLTGFTL